MKVNRRRFGGLAASAGALTLVGHAARAQSWPDRPIHLVVTFPPGGTNDIVARLMGDELSRRLGQPIIIDNKFGGGGNIGAEGVVRAPPDGYTLLQTTAANATNAALYPNLSFNFQRDLAPVAGIYALPLVLVVRPNFAAQTIPELIAYAKANPDKISHGSGGVGSISHIAAEMFKAMSGIRMVHVPYRGSTIELGDLVAGRIEMAFDPLPSSFDYIRDGRLKALAVTSLARSEIIPDTPTVASFLPGYEANVWVGLSAPRALPAAIVQRLNTEINAVLAEPAFRKRMTDLGVSPLVLTPDGFGKLIADDTEKWTKIIKAAGIKAE